MRRTRRQTKLLVSLLFVTVAYFASIYNTHYFRAEIDEKIVFPDIANLFTTGQLFTPLYGGLGYQASVVMLLKTLGLDPDSLGLLSPMFGALAIGFFATVLLLVARREAVKPEWSFLVPVVSMFVFPVFVKRMYESTHKSHTYVLVFGAIWSLYMFLKSDDKRYIMLVLLSLVSITFINHVWGLIWGGMVTTVLVLDSTPSRPIKLKRSNVRFSLPVLTIPLAVSVYLPYVSINVEYIYLFLGIFIGNTENVARVTGSSGTAATTALNLIAGWPSTTIAGFRVNVWFIYSAGMFVVGALTVVAGLMLLYAWWSEKGLAPIDRVFLGLSVYFGAVCLVFFFTGRVATLKRLVSVPGIFGSLYFVYWLSQYRGNTTGSVVDYRACLAVLLVLLAVSSGFAVKRTVLDGTGQPYDRFASANEVAKIEWVGEQPSDCLQSYGSLDRELYPKLVHSKRGSIEWSPTHNRIYDSGAGGVLTCTSVDTWWTTDG